MKAIFIICFTSWLLIISVVAEVAYSDARERKVAFKQGEEHFSQLIGSLHDIDMNTWLLSESKGVKWLLSDFEIIDISTIRVDLSDGNRAETVYFDWNKNNKSWTIIKREPIGDWKPLKERRGDRLTNIPFKTKHAEQGSAHQSTTR